MNDKDVLKEKVILHYLKRKSAGEDYTSIRLELKEKNLDEASTALIIRIIDDIIIREDLEKNKPLFKLDQLMSGWLLMISGGVMTVGTYFQIIPFFKGQYVLAYGPIIAGYFVIRSARLKEKRNNNRRIQFTRRFSKSLVKDYNYLDFPQSFGPFF